MNITFNSSFRNSSNEIITQYCKIFKNHLKKIIDYLESIKHDLNKIYANNIHNELNFILSKLKEYDYFKNEHYDFIKIKSIAEYILESEININHINFIESLISEFCKVFDIAKNKLNTEKYNDFKRYLNEKEEYFYTEIYNPTGKYDDLIVKATNTLG